MLHAAQNPDKWTPAIADMIVRGQVPDYKDVRYLNDFVLLQCSWLGDLNFPVSGRLIREAGYIEELLRCLPPDPGLDAARRAVLERLERA